MGFLDLLKGRKDKKKTIEKSEEEEHICALCGKEIKPGEGKYFGGQWWHKKCLRKARKMAKSAI